MNEKFERVEASVDLPGRKNHVVEVDQRIHNRCPHPLCQGKKGGTLLFKGRLAPGTSIEVVCPKCSKRANDTIKYRFGTL